MCVMGFDFTSLLDFILLNFQTVVSFILLEKQEKEQVMVKLELLKTQ